MRGAILITVLFGITVNGHAANSPSDPTESHEQLERQIQRAQERLEQAANEVAELSMKLDGSHVQGLQIINGSPRATLGLRVRQPPGGANDDSDGVEVVSVSPGGPADAAGLKANDVIVTFDGRTLRSQPGHPAQQELLVLTRAAKVDQPVAIEFKRDGKTQTVQVTPKSGLAVFMPPVPPMPPLPAMPDLSGLESLNHMFVGRDRSGLGSAELLDLSPGLGAYFGTDKGLLVVRAPRDERLKLLDGDVILDIDGRVPKSASHALQILNSYRSGEKLKVHIMRQQKRIELPIEIPVASANREFSLRDVGVGEEPRGFD